MIGPILEKVAALPTDAEMSAKHLIIEHDLRGNREQAEPLAADLIRQGKSARVDAIEVGVHLVIQDRPATFRDQAERRLRSVCHFANLHRLKYDSWWITGDRYSDYVSQ